MLSLASSNTSKRLKNKDWYTKIMVIHRYMVMVNITVIAQDLL